jgi:uncharacterized protein
VHRFLAWHCPLEVSGILWIGIYGIYGLPRPAFKPMQFGVSADGGIGFLNGLFGGLTGFTGIIATIWCQLRGCPKDVQRTVFTRSTSRPL